MCRTYYQSTAGSRDIRVLFAMVIGSEHIRKFPKLEADPFINHKHFHKQIRPDRNALRSEIIRRGHAYKNFPKRRPGQWNTEKCMDYLNGHPIPVELSGEFDFLESELKKWKVDVANINASTEANVAADHALKRAWHGPMPFLRLYHTLIDDELRPLFERQFDAMNREQLDGRNSEQRDRNFFEMAAQKYNDPDWVPVSLSLPQLHTDFACRKDLHLCVEEVTPEAVKKRLADCRAKMILVIGRWEQSGSGNGMMSPEDEQDVYQFMDGDDRQHFLRDEPTHVLYLWHITYEYQIFNGLRQQLSRETMGDGTGPVTVYSGKKRKKVEKENEEQCAELSRMTSSINNLVNIAERQVNLAEWASKVHEYQERRSQLEDKRIRLDDDILNIELSNADETSERKKVVYGLALVRKIEQRQAVQQELDTVLREIADIKQGRERASRPTQGVHADGSEAQTSGGESTLASNRRGSTVPVLGMYVGNQQEGSSGPANSTSSNSTSDDD